MTNEDYSVLPAESFEVPAFKANVSPFGLGCLLMIAAFLGAIIAANGSGDKFITLVLFLEVGALMLAAVVYYIREKRQVHAQEVDWMCHSIAAREKEAHDLTQNARQARDSLFKELRGLPLLLRDVDASLLNAEEEFGGKFYAPFWDNVEQAAIGLGAFNSSLSRIKSGVDSYKSMLFGRTHNFPALDIRSQDIPSPAQQTERLRQLVRSGQRDFEFATIWEHRKTQKIMLEGFRTVGEAISNVGLMVGDSLSRLNITLEEISGQQLDEQVRLRESFSDAVRKWKERKRLYNS